MRAKFDVLQHTRGVCLCGKFHLNRFILSPSIGAEPRFLAFFLTSAFSGVANWQQSEKVEHDCTTTNLPLSNDINIVSELQSRHGEIGRAISDVQKLTNKQTDKQTVKNTQRFGHPGGGRNSSPTKLGTVIEDFEHVRAPLKLLWV